MSDIKDILDNYCEAPSEAVWERLSERLDAEMPVRKSRFPVWKWVASALAVIAVAGGVAFGVLRHQHHGEEIADVKGTGQTVATQPQETVAGTQNVASPQEESSDVVVETSHGASLQEATPVVVEVTHQSASPKPEAQPAPVATSTPKTNVRQEILPPNSTLAKQLAADPVLKNLSDDSVDWSLPAHLSIPNIFTPNGDGVNDLFIIEGLENYSSPRLVVRDKNNRIVYQSANYTNTWDGGNCPEGVYSYELNFSYSQIESQATGKVRIIRS